MSPTRVALLAFCTLLIGAGIGFGATQLGGSDDDGGSTEPVAATTAASTTSAGATAEPGASDFAACRQDETFGCYQRAFRALVTAKNPGVALDELDALYKTDTYVLRTCHPLAHEIGHLAFAKYKSVHGGGGARARDVLVGLPPRRDGELHLAVQRRAAARSA